jgi:hypothetical protein
MRRPGTHMSIPSTGLPGTDLARLNYQVPTCRSVPLSSRTPGGPCASRSGPERRLSASRVPVDGPDCGP